MAERYLAAVVITLRSLAIQPGLGSRRQFRHPALREMNSFRLQSPFEAHLVFYRHTPSEFFAERLMHGARDLPRRLLEPPGSAEDALAPGLHRVSLIVGKVYCVLPDPKAAKDELVPIVDESGEDYLYHRSQFALVDFPKPVERKIMTLQAAAC